MFGMIMLIMMICFSIPTAYIWYCITIDKIKLRKKLAMIRYREHFIWLCQAGLGETAICFNTYGLKMDQQTKQTWF